jgi:hypothetical protein
VQDFVRAPLGDGLVNGGVGGGVRFRHGSRHPASGRRRPALPDAMGLRRRWLRPSAPASLRVCRAPVAASGCSR